MRRPGALYFGVFLTTLGALVYQVTTTRIFSVLTWYHLAFLSISLSMLGMTAAGLYVYLWAPSPTADSTRRLLVSNSIWFALSLPLSHIGLISLELPMELHLRASELMVLTLAVGLSALPFFFSGVVVAVALTRTPLPIGRIYGVDLLGASLGCLASVVLLELLDPSTVVLAMGALAGAAAVSFSIGVNGSVNKAVSGIALALAALAVANGVSYPNLIWVPRMNGKLVPTEGVITDRWNSHSRVLAWEPGLRPPHFWGQGLSPTAAKVPMVESVHIQIDGAAYTAATGFNGDPETLDWVRHGVASLAYQLRGRGDVAVIGVGGGRDVLTALGFGAASITGIEVNGILVELLQQQLREFTKLVGRDDVTLVHDDGRSWMARTDQRFDLIQMALIDTFASTSAGAMTLTENGLYTKEAWTLYLDRLKPGGVFSLSRFYHPGRISETARAMSLAVDTLLARGQEDPAQHIILVNARNVSTLIVGRDPFSAEDVDTVLNTLQIEGFTPRALPGYVTNDPILRGILNAKSQGELDVATRHPYFDLGASTDDRPFFFNMLKLSAWRKISSEENFGVIVGNLRATQTLVGLLTIVVVLAALTILGPLLLRGRRHGLQTSTFLAAITYFSLIGLGFMLVEIGLIQKFSILLGHPIHSLAITLMSMISASGLGSFASERIPMTSRRLLGLLPAFAALLIVAGATTVQSAVDFAMGASLPERIAMVVIFTFPIGFALGFFFPLGMKRLRTDSPIVQSWMWGMNGAFGVLGSLASIVISMTFGIRICLFVGAACYLLLVLPSHHLYGRDLTRRVV
ncbi:MAG: hypothetical protein BMS9Abin37_1480 [Acidobacteriota bacterium]|nr:MAG: hypothetical protein BMS9Abin37_1480 [Acidobacteriota bacterium]